MDRVRHLSLHQFPTDILVNQHQEIVDALRTGNTAKAETAMREHLNNIVDDIPVIAAAHPDLFTT